MASDRIPIIDSHCHAWSRWPYQPVVPDPESRGRIEQLLFEMDQNGVDQAVVICAQIGDNPDNNLYVADKAAEYAPRIHQFPDLDSCWSPTYKSPGAAERLSQMLGRWPIKGFTHYLSDTDDGSWLLSEEGLRLFRVAEEKRLIASIACRPHHQPVLRELAGRYPSVPILCHHLGRVSATDGPGSQGLKDLLSSAAVPNLYFKLSGFPYASRSDSDYPYSDVLWLVRVIYEHFGPHRLCWGSDYPVVRRFMTYRQSLEVFRTHCSFVPNADKQWILGGTLARLLSD